MSDDAECIARLQQACLGCKRGKTYPQLWEGTCNVIEAREALVKAQAKERKKELDAQAKLVRFHD